MCLSKVVTGFARVILMFESAGIPRQLGWAKWYSVLPTDGDRLVPISNRLLIAVFAALIASSIALAANYVLWRLKSGSGRAAFALAIGPFHLPPIVIAMDASVYWA